MPQNNDALLGPLASMGCDQLTARVRAFASGGDSQKLNNAIQNANARQCPVHFSFDAAGNVIEQSLADIQATFGKGVDAIAAVVPAALVPASTTARQLVIGLILLVGLVLVFRKMKR